MALAHFLALLIPGVDFFLIARTAMTSGWRNATGACLGIAAANGIFIAAAFSGISIISHPTVLVVIQLAGGAFLVFIGIAFMRSTPRLSHDDDMTIEQATWVKNFGLGIASGLLNPKMYRSGFR
ncbi:LysE family translocator [Brevibacterium aurantiacum]|uniref:LysE family translocator n=1 Tax=Brevibacterium aurantiacum TaxID=273384 RepID=UPI0021536088|nr:LysE family transporter [Brevibacterium aurantiacum]